MFNKHPNKIRYSQNFLKDSGLVRNLLAKSDITSHDTVLEIGAGNGIITQELLKKARKVIAFELDKNLFPQLVKKFQTKESLELKEEDFLTFNLPNYPYKIFSNIPFNITSAIIKIITFDSRPPEISYLIVQNEAAKKFAGKPINNINSQIAVILNPFFEFHIIHKFAPSDFYPKPNVETVLLEIKKRQKSLIDTENKQKYQDFVCYTFNQFKPNIRKGLSEIFKGHNRNLPKLRPSELNFENWYELFNSFINLPVNKQEIVEGSFTKQLEQQEHLDKIHRTRIDKNWRKFLK